MNWKIRPFFQVAHQAGSKHAQILKKIHFSKFGKESLIESRNLLNFLVIVDVVTQQIFSVHYDLCYCKYLPAIVHKVSQSIKSLFESHFNKQ